MEYSKYQEEIINYKEGNMVVIASAGSGKTTTIIERIYKLIKDGVRPENILYITFNTKVRKQMQRKIKNKHVNVETYHSLALKIIDASNKYIDIWNDKYEKDKILYAICNYDKTLTSEVKKFIATKKHNLIKPYEDDDNIEFHKYYKEFEDYKNKKGYIEYDDFMITAIDILDANEEELKIFQAQYKYIMVDEFQDISYDQIALLQKLNNSNIMAVGDPLQSIYSFRNGTNKHIFEFDKYWKDSILFHLPINYRCSKDIVDLSNDFVDKNLIYDSYVPAIAANDNIAKPTYKKYKNYTDEAESIAKEIAVKGNYNNTAIIARTNSKLQYVQTALAQHGIPFDIVDGKEYTDSMEIKIPISLIRLALNPNDNQSFTYIHNRPNRWFGRNFISKLYSMSNGKSLYQTMIDNKDNLFMYQTGIEDINDVIISLQNKKFDNVGQVISWIRERIKLDDYLRMMSDSKDNYIIENLNTFEDICSQYNTMEEMLNNMALIKCDRDAGAVKILTIHKCKGLEYETVYIISINDGVFPHILATDIKEEYRIMYVAMTRAIKELHMSSSSKKSSEFIKYLPKQNN